MPPPRQYCPAPLLSQHSSCFRYNLRKIWCKVNFSHLRQNGESKWESCRGEEEPSQSDRGRDQGSGVQLCIIILIVIFISVPIFVVQATPHLHQCPHNHHSPPFPFFRSLFRGEKEKVKQTALVLSEHYSQRSCMLCKFSLKLKSSSNSTFWPRFTLWVRLVLHNLPFANFL